MPFSISYYSPVLQYKQSRIHSFIYLLFHFLLDPDQCGSGSATLQKLLITGYCLLYLHRYRYSVCLLHWRHRGLTIFRIVSCPWCSTIMLSRCRKKLSRAQLCWLQRFCTSHFCLCPFAPQNPEKFDDLNIWKKNTNFLNKNILVMSDFLRAWLDSVWAKHALWSKQFWLEVLWDPTLVFVCFFKHSQ